MISSSRKGEIDSQFVELFSIFRLVFSELNPRPRPFVVRTLCRLRQVSNPMLSEQDNTLASLLSISGLEGALLQCWEDVRARLTLSNPKSETTCLGKIVWTGACWKCLRVFFTFCWLKFSADKMFPQSEENVNSFSAWKRLSTEDLQFNQETHAFCRPKLKPFNDKCPKI